LPHALPCGKKRKRHFSGVTARTQQYIEKLERELHADGEGGDGQSASGICQEPRKDGQLCGTSTPTVGRPRRGMPGETWSVCVHHASVIAMREGSCCVSPRFTLMYAPGEPDWYAPPPDHPFDTQEES
jgi:hypothetical protein